jgi:hypothetical protein
MIKKMLGCANLIVNEVLLTANIHGSSRIEDNSFRKREELKHMWMFQIKTIKQAQMHDQAQINCLPLITFIFSYLIDALTYLLPTNQTKHHQSIRI